MSEDVLGGQAADLFYQMNVLSAIVLDPEKNFHGFEVTNHSGRTIFDGPTQSIEFAPDTSPDGKPSYHARLTERTTTDDGQSIEQLVVDLKLIRDGVVPTLKPEAQLTAELKALVTAVDGVKAALNYRPPKRFWSHTK